MDGAVAVRSDRGEEIVARETDVRIGKLLAVSGEEDGAGARSKSDSENVSFGEGRTVRLRSEGVRMSFETI